MGVTVCLGAAACSKTDIVANTADAERTYNYWTPIVDGTGVGGDYDTYEQNPCIWYQTAKDWTYYTASGTGGDYSMGGQVTNNIALNFYAPSTGQEQNSFLTNLRSGEMDIMELSYSPDTVTEMYENGVTLDITWYVENYMPNYLAYLEENDLYELATNELDDGERHFLQLYSYTNNTVDCWQGYQYRRDWLLKFGNTFDTTVSVDGTTASINGTTFLDENPDWGYSYDEDGNKSWSDGIVFPSWYGYQYETADNGSESGMGTLTYNAELYKYIHGYYADLVASEPEGEAYSVIEDYTGQWPATISDWEWMMDIFQIAIEELGYTKKGYVTSLYSTGFVNSGNLVSSFGGGGPEWYYDKDGGISWGADGDTLETYMECVHGWYQNGWVDTEFQTHSDLFYRWDENTVWQGYVGLYNGHVTTLMDEMDTSDGDEDNPTYGICSYGMPFPINDKYGSSDEKYQDPYVYYGMFNEVTSVMITTYAETNGKDLAALFTWLDYTYSEESAVMKASGLTADQLAECSEAIQNLYAEYGCENGGCYLGEDGNYYMTEEWNELDQNAQYALKCNRVVGLEEYVPLENGDDPEYVFRLQLWALFEPDGWISDSFYNQLSASQYSKWSSALSNIRNTFAANVPSYIIASGDFDNDGWATFIAQAMSNNNISAYTKILNNLWDDMYGE